jgi:hypothetical protein
MRQPVSETKEQYVKRVMEEAASTPFGGEETCDLPGGLIHTDREIALAPEKIDGSRAEVVELTHRLEDLEKEFFLFTFAPVYAVTGFTHDVVYQFGSAMSLDRIPKVLQYIAPLPLFQGEGNWVFRLQGIPKERGTLFDRFVLNMVITDLERIPKTYWRVNSEEAFVYTPGVVSEGVKVKVYVPTGIDYRIQSYASVGSPIQFSRREPDSWVVAEAQRYFAAL